MKIVNYLLWIFFVAVTISTAQNNRGSIVGKVTDAVTKEVIPGVNIIVLGTDIGAATDEEGNFKITGIQVGTYQFRDEDTNLFISDSVTFVTGYSVLEVLSFPELYHSLIIDSDQSSRQLIIFN